VSAAWLEHAHRTLRAAGLRAGGGRDLVLEELARGHCLRAAQEIAGALHGRVGAATVYRALETLRELGLVARVDTGEGLARYEPAGPGGAGHHHTVCDRCGKFAPFADPELEQVLADAVGRLPFAAATSVVVHGACADCGLPREHLPGGTENRSW